MPLLKGSISKWLDSQFVGDLRQAADDGQEGANTNTGDSTRAEPSLSRHTNRTGSAVSQSSNASRVPSIKSGGPPAYSQQRSGNTATIGAVSTRKTQEEDAAARLAAAMTRSGTKTKEGDAAAILAAIEGLNANNAAVSVDRSGGSVVSQGSKVSTKEEEDDTAAMLAAAIVALNDDKSSAPSGTVPSNAAINATSTAPVAANSSKTSGSGKWSLASFGFSRGGSKTTTNKPSVQSLEEGTNTSVGAAGDDSKKENAEKGGDDKSDKAMLAAAIAALTAATTAVTSARSAPVANVTASSADAATPPPVTAANNVTKSSKSLKVEKVATAGTKASGLTKRRKIGLALLATVGIAIGLGIGIKKRNDRIFAEQMNVMGILPPCKERRVLLAGKKSDVEVENEKDKGMESTTQHLRHNRFLTAVEEISRRRLLRTIMSEDGEKTIRGLRSDSWKSKASKSSSSKDKDKDKWSAGGKEEEEEEEEDVSGKNVLLFCRLIV